METMKAIPSNHPMMLAWHEYQKNAYYENTKKWASYPDHVDGSLWAVFMAGWEACEKELGTPTNTDDRA